MTTREDLESALINADKAGDTAAATQLATALAGMPKSDDPTANWKPFIPSGEKKQLNMTDFALGHPVTRGAVGAVDPGIGLFQLGANAVGQGESVNKAIHSMNTRINEARKDFYDSEGFDAARTAGSVASPMLALKALKPAETLIGRMGQGSVVGAAAGAADPLDNGEKSPFWYDKAMQTGAGGAIGLALPLTMAAGTKAGQMIYHAAIEPWANPAAIKGRAYLEAAGNKLSEIKDLLMRNKQIVPGSAPTAGEAASPAGRTEFSALQESAGRAAPSDYLARNDAQNAARLDSLKEFAGTPAKRAEAVEARSAAAGPHYDLGESQKLPFDVQTFGELTARPSTQAAVKRAQRLIQEETGQKIDIPDLVKNQAVTGAEAQKIKLAFDDLIKLFPKSGMDTKELEAIKNTRGAYVKWMEENFPALKEARRTYKEASAPINEMDVGKQLVEKLEPALRDDAKLRSGAFSSAVRDSASTIKKATGEPRFEELRQVLSSRSLQSVHNVQDDLARADRHLEMARRGAGAGPNALDLATASIEKDAGGKFPNMLHRGAMIANAIIARLEGKVNKKLASEMAAEMLDPPKVSEALAVAEARRERNKFMAEQIMKAQRAGIIAGAQSTDGGM